MVSVQRHGEGPALDGADSDVPAPDFRLLTSKKKKKQPKMSGNDRFGSGGCSEEEEPRPTAPLLLLLAGDSLNVSVKQLRSAAPTQGNGQSALVGADPPRIPRRGAEPSASLEGMALI